MGAHSGLRDYLEELHKILERKSVSLDVQQCPTKLIIDISALRKFLAAFGHSYYLIFVKCFPFLSQFRRWGQYLVKENVMYRFGGCVGVWVGFDWGHHVQDRYLIFERENTH